MIRQADIVEIGQFLKTHGINGEINYLPTIDVDLMELNCIITDIDGIYVPFFVKSTRKKGKEALIVGIDDINNEKEAALLTNKTVYARADKIAPQLTDESDNDEDSLSAYDLIGFTVTENHTGHVIGTIDHINDATENWLFMVETEGDDKRLVAIPVADDFITDIDLENKKIEMALPAGLLEL